MGSHVISHTQSEEGNQKEGSLHMGAKIDTFEELLPITNVQSQAPATNERNSYLRRRRRIKLRPRVGTQNRTATIITTSSTTTSLKNTISNTFISSTTTTTTSNI